MTPGIHPHDPAEPCTSRCLKPEGPGLKIYLSNGTFIEMPGATPQVCENVAKWFGPALDGDVLVLNLADVGEVVRVQKRHIVRIDTPL